MQSGSRRKRSARTAAEVDTVAARRIYCYLDRAGVAAGIKRQMRRRERREGRDAVRRGED